jgi:hypothetical protein
VAQEKLLASGRCRDSESAAQAAHGGAPLVTMSEGRLSLLLLDLTRLLAG